MYQAIDKNGRELVEGDVVITQGRLAMFSHCTEKRMMVKLPSFSGRTPWSLVQRTRHDVAKFVPELKDDFLEKMAQSQFAHNEWKKENGK